ncbi:hypothetical protein [Sphaerisporangium siamense]|uniref:ABC-type hemin transport system ATPase subunit n=1 Tax=Sphaerisporangium siamense TaxID=795645 RepID=A0A7W7D2Y8_9ACTN|nr:hypothetical protein [Sphaerisporangium siamense]MBB4699359.1 ABC-type hemin transport system ATPase subunit [Sphaerisporangium siamense]
MRALGISTPAAPHDLNRAAAYRDRLSRTDSGPIPACGPQEEVLTVERISRGYGVRAVPRAQLVFELKEER